VNHDSRPDIILTPSEPAGSITAYRVSWLEAPAWPASADWVEHVIDPAVQTVLHSLQVVDVDHDGDLDVITAEMHQSSDPDVVSVYLNAGGMGGGLAWTRVVVGTGGSHGIRAADMDGDGYVDFFGANWTGTRVVDLWLNRGRLVREDFNRDGHIDSLDWSALVRCATGPSVPYDVLEPPPGCGMDVDPFGLLAGDLDRDGDIDSVDFGVLQRDLGSR
jgi:hypothetical protein